ncbi:hypothetical protein Bbelb_054120 [Branchiostoma belcheri]|nr:hypothetical protein Bbelb_054120 [Branchiostoma belcheri]
METSLDINCEIVWAKVKLRGKRDLLFGSYYRPHVNLEDSLREMGESARLACHSRNAIVVLGGDFNLPDWDWEKKVLKSGSSYPNIHRQFMDTINDLGMEQVVEKPTRGGNTLDLIVTNHPSLFQRIEIVPGLSDHDIPYVELQVTNARVRQKERQVPCFKQADWNGLRKSIQVLSDSILATHAGKPDVEAVWTDLKTGLQEKVQEFIPHKKISGKRNPSIKRQVQRQLRQQYWKHVEGLITEDCSDQPKPAKKFWTFIKARRNENTGVSPLKDAGKLVTDDKERAEILNQQFKSAFSTGEVFSDEDFKLRCPMPPRNPEQPILEDITITTAGVEKLLQNLDPSKASGPDQISPRVLREIAVELAPSLAFLYQASLDQGVVPDDWKRAHVCPVFKKGERYKAENYRPISLTSLPCKLLEHILVSNIMSYWSVLGPSLFLLFINDLPTGLTSSSRLFAGDTACHKLVKVARDQDHLQDDLDKLAEWEQRWKMCFHPQKCVTLHMTRSRKTRKREYRLHGHILQEEPQATYLGVTITRDLKWEPHIVNITNKANRCLGFVRRNIKINSKNIKQAAHKALVRPILEYGSTVWDPHTDKNITAVEKVQRRAARWVCSRFRRTSSVGAMLQDLQ